MTTATLQTLIEAVDSILLENLEHSKQRFAPFLSKPVTENVQPATMKSDKLIQCDMNVELWETALHAILRDITAHTYPHYSVIQNTFNYLLNCHKYTDFGLVSVVMSHLHEIHPPGSKTMHKYYKRILLDKYAKINEKREEDQPFFWVIIDMVKNLSKDSKIIYQPHPLPPEEINKDVKAALKQLSGKNKPKPVTFYNDLSLSEQRKRCTVCLKFLCDILVKDFTCWLSQTEFKNKRCLLARLLWLDKTQEGYVNQNVQKIIALQEESFLENNQTTVVCEKLLLLTAELIGTYDHRRKIPYPFFGPSTNGFSREFASYLVERLNEDKMDDYLNRLTLPWLRLKTTSQLLSSLAGFQCLPELQSAITILEHLDYIYKVGRQQTRQKESPNRPPADPAMVSKFSKLQSVNACFRSGLSRLQSACHDDNIEAVRALLTFPSLDLNQTDASGWTALHEAARRGSEACVREMLAYAPPVGSVQRRIDTRARGPGNYTPLMKAVLANHANICSALLKHTGSVLLEDITDENETVMDLCQDSEIMNILKAYQETKVETIFSRKELHLNTGNLSLVAMLCAVLVESYFSVHCTWKVYHAIKNHTTVNEEIKSTRKCLFEYSRYHRDIKTNLPKIRTIVMKLKKIPELAAATQILTYVVSLNKV